MIVPSVIVMESSSTTLGPATHVRHDKLCTFREDNPEHGLWYHFSQVSHSPSTNSTWVVATLNWFSTLSARETHESSYTPTTWSLLQKPEKRYGKCFICGKMQWNSVVSDSTSVKTSICKHKFLHLLYSDACWNGSLHYNFAATILTLIWAYFRVAYFINFAIFEVPSKYGRKKFPFHYPDKLCRLRGISRRPYRRIQMLSPNS